MIGGSEAEAQVARNVGDVVAAVTAAGVFVEWLPIITGVLAAGWMILRFYEYIRWVWRGRRKDEKPF